MSVIELLSTLRAQGITVEPRPDGRLYIAPAERLTPDLIARLRAHKPEILAVLAGVSASCVAAIRAARGCGWQIDQLVSLVKALERNDEIAEVSDLHIAVLRTRRTLERFYRVT